MSSPPAERLLLSSLEPLKASGFNFFTGVADSLVASIIEALEEDPAGYIPAVREDLAVGLASGAYLAGRWPAVLMQNSGLGYCLNVLTSLNLIYKIPVLLIVGYRGYRGEDAPEHLVMGAHCEALLKEVGIPVFVPEPGEWERKVSEANEVMRLKEIPAAVFVKPGILDQIKQGAG
ncbi:MAG: sulfopyruvate decarboxylase subunit alpha [Candidatus Omnitrophica bacterium]|nr:sulfopyruvate decarboxylase subunit alpha [Candidatus Omnitrophota bacterium]